MIASEVKTLNFFADGQAVQSGSGKYADIFDPSTGQVIARTPLCTQEEVNRAIQPAQEAFPAWADTPAIKKVQVLYRFRDPIDRNLDGLTRLVCTENGKVWDEAQGDVLKAKEAVELACGGPLDKLKRPLYVFMGLQFPEQNHIKNLDGDVIVLGDCAKSVLERFPNAKYSGSNESYPHCMPIWANIPAIGLVQHVRSLV